MITVIEIHAAVQYHSIVTTCVKINDDDDGNHSETVPQAVAVYAEASGYVSPAVPAFIVDCRTCQWPGSVPFLFSYHSCAMPCESSAVPAYMLQNSLAAIGWLLPSEAMHRCNALFCSC